MNGLSNTEIIFHIGPVLLEIGAFKQIKKQFSFIILMYEDMDIHSWFKSILFNNNMKITDYNLIELVCGFGLKPLMIK